jgi:hypothetical protein
VNSQISFRVVIGAPARRSKIEARTNQPSHPENGDGASAAKHRIRNDKRAPGKTASPNFAVAGRKRIGVLSAAEQRIARPDCINNCFSLARRFGVELDRAHSWQVRENEPTGNDSPNQIQVGLRPRRTGRVYLEVVSSSSACLNARGLFGTQALRLEHLI